MKVFLIIHEARLRAVDSRQGRYNEEKKVLLAQHFVFLSFKSPESCKTMIDDMFNQVVTSLYKYNGHFDLYL